MVDVCIHHRPPCLAGAAHRQQAVAGLCWLCILPVCQQLVDDTPANEPQHSLVRACMLKMSAACACKKHHSIASTCMFAASAAC